MNKFQRKVKRRRKLLLKYVGKGDMSDRDIIIWIRQLLREQLRNKEFKLK